MYIANNHTVVIAAVSSRAYVKTAVDAGFRVVALDAFADADTQKFAHRTFRLNMRNGQFELQSVLDVISALNMDNCAGFCYGAGFESTPGSLAEIGKHVRLLGNDADTVRACKNPESFFSLCDALDMLYPQTSFKHPQKTDGWLSKTVGASGGAHIVPLSGLNSEEAGDVYYQKVQPGTPVSCLFFAGEKKAQIIGYSEQWCNPIDAMPYRYGGAVSHAGISAKCRKTIEDFLQAVVLKLNLRGINSCDFIIYGDSVYALEINPRLSATVDLYRTEGYDLFAMHIAAFVGGAPQNFTVSQTAKAHQIIYAKQKIGNLSKIDWPDWVCDVPCADTTIDEGMPVCTVTAEAPTSVQAKKKVAERAMDCESMLC